MLEYDILINEKLNGVYAPETNISCLDDLLNLELSENDKKTFSLLYPLKPLTKSGNKDSNIVGKGEIAFYWLIKYNQTQYNVKSNIYDKYQPDYTINEVGVEIKSFDTDFVNLGRFSNNEYFGDLLEILNVSYTISTIYQFENSLSSSFYSTLSINYNQLNEVFTNVYAAKSSSYGGIKNAFTRLEYIYSSKTGKNLPEDSNELSKFFITELIKTKISNKPGIGGFIINLQSNGNLKANKITKDLIESQLFSENCFKYASSSSGCIKINFKKIFGVA